MFSVLGRVGMGPSILLIHPRETPGIEVTFFKLSLMDFFSILVINILFRFNLFNFKNVLNHLLDIKSCFR